MARRILVVPATDGAGATAACLGMARALQDRRVAVAYAKPFEQALDRGEDQSTELFRLTMALRPPQPISAADLEHGLAAGQVLEVMSAAVDLTAELEAGSRVLLLEGLAATAAQPAADRINVELAQAYDAEVVLVGSADRHAPEQLAERLETMRRLHTVRGESRVIGVVVNRLADAADADGYRSALEAHGFRLIGTVPLDVDLTYRRVSDLVRDLRLDVVRDGETDRRVRDTSVIAENAPTFLSAMREGNLLIVPGNRHEVLMAAALAEAGGTRLAAVLCTGGLDPDPGVLALCEAAVPSQLPILATTDRTFEVLQRILALSGQVAGDDEDRARRLMTAFADALDPEWVAGLDRHDRPARITPARFTQHVADRTAAGITRIAVTDAADARVLRAVAALERCDKVQCVLVASPEEVEAAAEDAGLDLVAAARIVDPRHVELPAVPSGVELPLSADDPFLKGVSLCVRGEVDGVVGGIRLDRVTAIRAAGLLLPQAPAGTVSASQFVELVDEVLLYADTALIAEPDARRLADIALQTADTAEVFGLETRIAFIRPSSSSPRNAEQRRRIEEAMSIVRDRRPDLDAAGPLAYGVATSRVSTRAQDGQNATVLVFPEIASATATLRGAAGTTAIHVYPPLTQGLGAAVNVVPRDASVQDVVDLIRATALQAGYQH